MPRPLKDINPKEILRNAFLTSVAKLHCKAVPLQSQMVGGKALVPHRNLLLFIVLTVGLENHFKSKQINVYWAVKGPSFAVQ